MEVARIRKSQKSLQYWWWLGKLTSFVSHADKQQRLTMPSELIPLPESLPDFLKAYLPSGTNSNVPFVTLTYAASIDSRIAEQPGMQTAISHLETKTMTHYIRSRHDAILIGVGTVLADDPGLNCRWKEPSGKAYSIRPVIVDPRFKWNPTGSRLLRTVKEGEGLAPLVIVTAATYSSLNENKRAQAELIKEAGGDVVPIETDGIIEWSVVFAALGKRGIQSVMVEGGANVINQLLLRPDLVSSLIVTVGPVYLGAKGVEVSPDSKCTLQDVSWWRGTQDVVLAAHIS